MWDWVKTCGLFYIFGNCFKKIVEKIGFPDIVWSGARAPWPSRDQKNTKKKIVFELRVYLFCIYSFIAGNRTENLKIYIRNDVVYIPIQEHWKDQREKRSFLQRKNKSCSLSESFRIQRVRNTVDLEKIILLREGPKKIQHCLRIFQNQCPPPPRSKVIKKTHPENFQQSFWNHQEMIRYDLGQDGMGWDGYHRSKVFSEQLRC